jgi:hypothetical protein
MRTPGTVDLVRVWELGMEQPAWYRGLLMLVPAFPELSIGDLSTVALGTRNAYLFALRRSLFGSNLAAGILCERCREPIEFELCVEDVCDLGDILRTAPAAAEATDLSFDGVTLSVRAITSRDLSAFHRETPLALAEQALRAQAVTIVTPSTEIRAIENLSQAQLSLVIETLQEHDPYAETWLQLSCQGCKHEWSSLLDIAAYLWAEITAVVQRVLDEVATIAQAFGWSEHEILKMSPGRREFYLAKSGMLAEELR